MDKEQKKSIIVKVCCVFLAFSLWLYITSTQNPIVTYTVRRVPVQIKNQEILSQNKLSLDKNDGYYVDIKVQSKSSEPKVKASDFRVSIDLSGYLLKKGENKLPIEIEHSPANVSIVNSGNLWLGISIDQVIETTVPVKINVVGKDKDNKFLNEVISSPSKVRVFGPSKIVNQVKSVEGEFDLAKATEIKTASVKVKPVNALGDEVKGVTLELDTVHVALGVNSTKSVPVKVVTKGESPSTFKIVKTEASPSTIKIMGDENLIKNIEFIETESLDLTNLTETTTKRLNLILPQGIEILDSHNIVDVKVSIDKKYLEKRLSSNIEVSNLSNEYTVTMQESTISYKVGGNEDIISKAKESDFKVFVDLNNMKEGTHSVNVEITAPSGISVTSKSVDKINVTLTKKSQEAH